MFKIKLLPPMLLAGFVLGLTNPVRAADPKPTIVMAHGAFADGSSWDGVAARLSKDGYPIVVVANPLRSLRGDAAYVAAILKSLPGPLVVVGHSYGGAVISSAAVDQPNVKALVFVAAFEPAPGESSLELSSRFPGSTLAANLAPPVSLPDGGAELSIRQDRFTHQFAADVPAARAAAMAASQRPIAQAALLEPQTGAAWLTIPSWSIWGDADRNIPPAAMAFMAERAKAKSAVVVKGASHAIMISHPAEVAAIVEAAATPD